ncbi:hypothetical protein ACIHFD_66675 [Nonomuraea sp. NPDC051941]|uniref:hypothetical protein n=1 Tax=Nonomuraea sp. NPDC051941 TaxID=3364373 RepID=UPI0037C89246
MTKTLIAPPLLIGLLVAFAVGCGSGQGDTGVASVAVGSSAKPSASPAPTGTADPQEQGRKFAQCMRDHGIPMEDPDPNGGGGLQAIGENADKKKVMDAVAACQAYAPFKDRKNLDPEQVDKLRELARCMRENGVDWPDPNPDGSFSSGTALKLDRNNPTFKKAFEICGKKFPKLGERK